MLIRPGEAHNLPVKFKPNQISGLSANVWKLLDQPNIENSAECDQKLIRSEEAHNKSSPNLSPMQSVVCLPMCGNCSTNQMPGKGHVGLTRCSAHKRHLSLWFLASAISKRLKVGLMELVLLLLAVLVFSKANKSTLTNNDVLQIQYNNNGKFPRQIWNPG